MSAPWTFGGFWKFSKNDFYQSYKEHPFTFPILVVLWLSSLFFPLLDYFGVNYSIFFEKLWHTIDMIILEYTIIKLTIVSFFNESWVYVSNVYTAIIPNPTPVIDEPLKISPIPVIEEEVDSVDWVTLYTVVIVLHLLIMFM